MKTNSDPANHLNLDGRLAQIQIVETLGLHHLEDIDRFYSENGMRAKARPDDLFFLAKIHDTIVGSVRFCIENELPLLRSMMIAPGHRGKKIGRMLLETFNKYLDDHCIRNTHCLPYSHLDKFYGKIGFCKIDETEAPLFIAERVREYRARGQDTILIATRLVLRRQTLLSQES